MSPIVVAVHGATGLQGGSVTRTLAAAGYKVHAIVRDPNAAKAKELASLHGVTLVQAGLDKASLTKAYAGADAVYACTPLTPTEEDEGKAMADAAAAAGVKTFVWSTLESSEKVTKGSIPVHHFDAKARVREYIISLGLPAVFLHLGAFFDNFINFGGISIKDGAITLVNMGVKLDTKVPQVAIRQDLGRAVDVILKNRDDFLGKNVYLAPFAPTPKEQAVVVERITGKKTTAIELPYPAEMKELGDMAEYFNTWGLYKDVMLPDPILKKHGFEPTSWDEFVKKEVVPHLGV